MIKRTLTKALTDHLTKKEITFIVGPRQSGKTTLILFLKDSLEKRGKRTVFLNLDIENHKQFFVSQDSLIRKVQLEIGKENGYVFIDEIQRKENAGIFLKGIYDMNLPYKYVVSGSGSVELKEKIHESLVGRKRIFELSTLSFEEFANFKTDYKYEGRLHNLFELDKEKLQILTQEYLQFGGYPRVVLEDMLKEKIDIIDEIYQSYLEKDVSYLLGVQKTEAFTNLLKIMASQTGNMINFSELSSTIGISVKTIQQYLWYLQKTFILQIITPYFKNLRKEITRSPIFYFYDIGLRNYALGIFGRDINHAEGGFIFQNLIFNLIKEAVQHTSAKVHFWRTKDGAEVDFVIDNGKEITPVEVKYSAFMDSQVPRSQIPRSMISFILKYQPANAFIVNLSLKKDISLKKTSIHFIPFYELSRYFKLENAIEE